MKALTRVLTVSLFASLPGLASSDVVEGLSKHPTEQSQQAEAGNINFDPPCNFVETLPLEQYQNPATNALFGLGILGAGAVLDECGNFGVSGYSSPNFLAFNCDAVNVDGSVPALPELVYFPSRVREVSMKLASSSGTGQTGGFAVFDAGFNVIGADTVSLTSAAQTVSFSSGAPNIQAIAIIGPCVMVVDDMLFD